jgi:hypothetical protein
MKGCEPLISGQDVPPRYRVGRVASRRVLPRERFSPLAQMRSADRIEQCRLLGVNQKTLLTLSASQFDPGCVKTQKIETR